MHQRIVLVFLISISGSVLADAYSDALMEEASGLSVDSQTSSSTQGGASRPVSSSDWSLSGQSLGEGLPSNLSQEKFEEVLKKLYYGTYAFYSNLTAGDALKVYNAYLETSDIDKIRDLATQLQ